LPGEIPNPKSQIPNPNFRIRVKCGRLDTQFPLATAPGEVSPSAVAMCLGRDRSQGPMHGRADYLGAADSPGRIGQDQDGWNRQGSDRRFRFQRQLDYRRPERDRRYVEPFGREISKAQYRILAARIGGLDLPPGANQRQMVSPCGRSFEGYCGGILEVSLSRGTSQRTARPGI